MTPPIHLTMPSTLVSSMVEEVVMRWGEEEEELILITSDGHKLAASPSLLMLHSPLLSSMLLESKKEAMSISVPGSAAQVSALLNFISRGETTFKNPAMLTKVKWLAADMGIDLFNIKTQLCLGSETSSLAEQDGQEEEENYGFGSEKENTNEKGNEKENINENEEGISNEKSEGYLVDEICQKLVTVELRSKLQEIKDANSTNQELENSRKYCEERENLQCNLCPQTYKSKSKLKIHSLCHSNLKCEYCGKGFVFGTLLKRHIESVHSNTGPKIINHAEFSIKSVNRYEYLGGSSIFV